MLLKLVRILRPRGGWPPLLLLLATMACLPLAIGESRWLSGATELILVALLAAWLGYTFGHTPLPGWLVGLIGFLSSLEWNTLTVGRLLPGWGAFWAELVRSGRWLSAGLHGRWGADLPFASLALGVWTRALALLERLAAWSQSGLAGTPSYDRLVLLLFVAVGVWWVSFFAGWQLARGRSALWACLPAGCAILSNVSLTYGAGINYLRAYLSGALLLMVVGRFQILERQWQRERIDYSGELERTVQLAGLGLTALIVVAALLVPNLTWKMAVDLFWRYAYDPWTAATQRLDRLFAGRNPVVRPTSPASATGGGGGYHELSGEPDLSSAIVFYVQTSDPAPLPPEYYRDLGEEPQYPQHYWRLLTYDTYTGRGWENSPLQRLRRTAGEPLALAAYPHTVLTQTYELLATNAGAVPAANEPLLLDRACTVSLRAGEDLASISTAEKVYTAISHLPAPTVYGLQRAGEEYPAEVAERYLALPSIPARVRSLAQELTATAATPYAKAAAIEGYLRTFEYDLAIAAPPPGEDVVEYLLFRTRRAYCDYYATAMVVMLRAAGVPARYASGFALGSYSYQRNAYAVRQRDAHAWTEVYFPGYGWVEFEPTPYRAALTRPLGGATPLPSPAAPRPQSPPRRPPTGLAVALLIGTLLALAGVFGWTLAALHRRRDLTTARLAQQIYARMLRWAGWLRLGPAPGDTPLEFSERLGRELEKRASWAKGAAEDAGTIGRTYVQARYAAAPLAARDAGQALGAWERLRRKLRWLLFWRRGQGTENGQD